MSKVELWGREGKFSLTVTAGDYVLQTSGLDVELMKESMRARLKRKRAGKQKQAMLALKDSDMLTLAIDALDDLSVRELLIGIKPWPVIEDDYEPDEEAR